MRVSALSSLVLVAWLAGCPAKAEDEGTDEASTDEQAEASETETGNMGEETVFGPTCNPSLGACSDTLLCCSIDPAALDLEQLDTLVLPAYEGRNDEGGIPLFADANNALSRRGICIEDGKVPIQSALQAAPGCPVPCNPQWSADDITAVCGANAICCQGPTLQPSDCVFDPSLGDAGCFRPVTGFDIVGLGGAELSEWGATEHATHQDPGLEPAGACESFVAGLPPEADVAAARAACRRRLSVASQHGFCLFGAVVACPEDQPSFRDACEQLSDDMGLTSCNSP